jgi:hypothetical protein
MMTTNLLAEIKGPIYFRLGVVAYPGETIYFADEDCHFTELVDVYCHETNAAVKRPIKKVQAIAVGKTVPYGIVLLAKPYRTCLVVSKGNRGDDGYIPVDITPQFANVIDYDERYTEKCRLSREFEGQIRTYLRRMEEFFDEATYRPLADGH